MQLVKFDMDRAIIVRRVVDEGPFFLFHTRCGQEIRVVKNGLSIEVHPEIDGDTSFAVLDAPTRNGANDATAILAAAELTTLKKIFSENMLPFPGLRCALATPA